MSSLLTGSNVQVIYGAHSIRAEVAGLSIAQVHLIYSTLFNISDDCEAFVNGAFAKGATLLRVGDRVEYGASKVHWYQESLQNTAKNVNLIY